MSSRAMTDCQRRERRTHGLLQGEKEQSTGCTSSMTLPTNSRIMCLCIDLLAMSESESDIELQHGLNDTTEDFDFYFDSTNS